MRLLLDTHVYLWWLDNPALLSSKAVEVIEDPRNTVFVSAAVSWEITIKQAIGKLNVPHEIMAFMNDLNFIELPITIQHTKDLAQLENIHNDPFDRILLAQAKADKLTFITRDRQSLKYSGIKMIRA
ncbi:MAG: type II toxin-antitoxin system VapC family toxin [Cyclobacteriaceae bacterium]|nr:type II toxin-antitoxin system VapC family toxin [Cyclobacteriaceae bacterium]